MKHRIALAALVLTSLAAAACTKPDEKAAASSAASGATKPESIKLEAPKEAVKPAAKAGEAEEKPAAPKVDVSPEMTAFLALFGDHKGVKSALTKYGKPGLDGKDMDMYDLNKPVVVAQAAKGAATCYTVDSAAGMTTRTYDVCWEKGKVVEIADKGMR